MVQLVMMPKILKNKKTLFFLTAAALLAAALVLAALLAKAEDLPSRLRYLGYGVEVKNVTFQGHESQNISAKKDKENIFLKIVKDVEKDSAPELLKKLEEPIENAQNEFTLSDPYTGKERTSSIPKELRPKKEETNIKGESLGYYLVYANGIFSLKIYSAEEPRYQGLFSTYFCENKKTAYKLEIYHPIGDFDLKGALKVLSSLFCK